MRALGAVVPSLIADLAGLGGGALIVLGAWDIYRPAGEIVAGVLLLAGVSLYARGGTPPPPPE